MEVSALKEAFEKLQQVELNYPFVLDLKRFFQSAFVGQGMLSSEGASKLKWLEEHLQEIG